MTAVGRPFGALVVLGVLLVGGWWAAKWRIGVGEPVTTTEVRLLLNDFTPDAVAVTEDTTVTWRFDGTVVHDITGDGWGTPARSRGVFSHTFDAPGTYDYRCTLHGPMRGQVIVHPVAD